MKILVVSPYLPSRASGSPVRLRGLLSRLAASHSLTLVSLVRPQEPAELVREARSFCDDVVTVPNERFGFRGARKRAFQLASLLSTRSSFRLVHHRGDFQAAVDRIVERDSFDVIQIENCFMGHYAFPPEPPLVVDEHNVDWEILARTATLVRAQPRRFFNQVDAQKLRIEEESCWRRVDACAVPSARDAATVRAAAPHARVAVVPNSVDTEFFSPGGARPASSTILFFGTLSYYPNTDGLLFFLREIMPLVRRDHPSARLVIVGREPPAAVRDLAAPDITVTGHVADVRPYLQEARVIIAPLRIGGGTRLKILEAMAMAKPVVSTAIGAEGIAASDEKDILLADDPQAFAAQIGRILDDDALAARLGEAGRHLVETEYEWSASACTLEALHRAAIVARRDQGALPERAAASAGLASQ